MRRDAGSRPRVAIFGPALTAVSGVSTHINMLLESTLVQHFDLMHFRVGSEGRLESGLQKLGRIAFSPLELVGFLLKLRVDIVHLNTSLDMKAFWRDLAYLIVAKLLHRSVVNQIHGGFDPQVFFPSSAFLRWILRQFLVRSDALTVLSTGEFAAYKAFDGRIKVHLVPNAIDPSGLLDEPRSFNRSLPLRLVYVGRLVESKGLFEAVGALQRLRQQGRQFTFLIAGTGRDDLRLRQAVNDAGIEECTQFLGGVFGDAKKRLWLDSDVFLLPSHFEGLPYALLEAMAAGCVPIVTPLSAISEVVGANLHGLLIPPKNASRLACAVAELDDDRNGLAEMAEKCRQRVRENYTIGRLAIDIGTIYHEVLHL
jgi:glycosyltransferase involved in cell wall biosynthesis